MHCDRVPSRYGVQTKQEPVGQPTSRMQAEQTVKQAGSFTFIDRSFRKLLKLNKFKHD